MRLTLIVMDDVSVHLGKVERAFPGREEATRGFYARSRFRWSGLNRSGAVVYSVKSTATMKIKVNKRLTKKKDIPE